jgi:hypothetical protein
MWEKPNRVLHSTSCAPKKVGNDHGENGNWRRGININFSLAPLKKTGCVLKVKKWTPPDMMN